MAGTTLQYGPFFHAENECRVSIAPAVVFTEPGPVKVRTRWTIEGEIVVPPALALSPANSTAYLTAYYLALRNAYAVPRRDLRYFAPTGNLAQEILWADTYDGIRFDGPTIRPQDGEWANSLRYTIGATAEIFLQTPPAGLVRYVETFSFGGGGPLMAFSDPILDVPKPIQLRAQTTFRATQRIEAVGRFDYPNLKPNIGRFPPLVTGPTYDRGMPESLGNGEYRNWPVTMTAQYESAYPLVFTPKLYF